MTIVSIDPDLLDDGAEDAQASEAATPSVEGLPVRKDQAFVTDMLDKILDGAKRAAYKAAAARFERIGDNGACGFAWVNIYAHNGEKITGNTKMGRALKKAGVSQDYRRIFHVWNPSNLPVQSVEVLEVGALAFADVLERYGFETGVGSRLD